MKSYNLAIIGLGGMGNWHRELINEGAWFGGKKVAEGKGFENLSVCGSYDIAEDRQQFARDHGLRAYGSLEELLGDPAVDAVLVSVPNELHRPMVLRALEAGKHVVCEKPAALNSGELRDMIDASRKAGKVFAVHQNRRWDEDYLTAKKIYDEKMLGEVFRIESRVHGSRGIPGDWRGLPEHGGGMVLDWGVHILDQALQMIPEKVKKVYAVFTHVTNELVDDGFYAEMTFENGLVYLAEVGTSNFINLPRWYILGRDGTALMEDFSPAGKIVRVTDWSKNDAVPIRTAAGLTKTMAPRTSETIKEEALPVVKSDIRDFYRNFLKTIEGKESLVVSLDSVMRNMLLMEAIFLSVKLGAPIAFE
ncbi:MAG: Gfo/Idh/MocA family oxidoreductase [Treponema sp.]|jgi:predicted dehydrogenase|nr:Gfo/Idh/MocA family oxidoreductase [Treponema sp.]